MVVRADDIVEQEIGMIALTEDKKSQVESVLSHLCERLKARIDARIVISPLISAAVHAFSNVDWYVRDALDSKEMATEKIALLMNEVSTEWSVEDVVPGYVKFLDYKLKFVFLNQLL